MLCISGKTESKSLSPCSFKDGRFEIMETCQMMYLVLRSTWYWYHALDGFQLNVVYCSIFILNAYLVFILYPATRIVCFNFVLQLIMQLLWNALFYLTTSQGFPIPALLRNQMEQTMESYSSAIRQAKSVTCGLADAFPQTPSQSVPNDR